MAPAVQFAEGLSITLTHAAPAEPWATVAIVITKASHRHRITFNADQPIDAVFCPEIVAVLTPILNSFSGNSGVYSNPDLEIDLPGLTLRQLRVIYSTHGTNPARVLVRFAGLLGNPHRALLQDDGFSHPMDTLASEVYRDALDWVLMPALNIAMTDEAGAFGPAHKQDVEIALAHLRRSKEQLLFQVELVKRELGRLEAHAYSKARPRPALRAAEPDQEPFRTLQVIRDLD